MNMAYRDALSRLAGSAHSLRPEEQWFEAVLQDGAIPGMLPGDRITAKTAINGARERVPKLKYTSEAFFGHFLRKQGCFPWRTSSVRGWQFPELNEARERWERKFGTWVWDDPTLTEWRIPG